MQTNRRASTFPLGIAIALFAGLPAAPFAAEAPPAEVRVTVMHDQLAVESMRFADAASVERWLESRRARVRAIDSCEGAATPQLLAAVERFYPARAGVLEVRALGATDADCAVTSSGEVPDAMYLQTDESGRSVIP
jgi:hypothetical protein